MKLLFRHFQGDIPVSSHDTIKKLPSHRSKSEIENRMNQYTDWFYPFVFMNGAQTIVNNNQVAQIHMSRAALIFPHLDEFYEGKWGATSCCDIACNQGWFATQIALRGAKHVTGIDARIDHITMANEIKALSDLPNLSFEQRDLFTITPENTGKFSFTLFLGILYHVDNPMGAIRVARSITKDMCIVETQVARCASLEGTWGASANKRSGPGIAVFPSDESHVYGKNALTFVPTAEALYKMLFAGGFSRIYQCIPDQTVNEQYRTNDRIILFAFV
jgi:hypothetical protein